MDRRTWRLRALERPIRRLTDYTAVRPADSRAYLKKPRAVKECEKRLREGIDHNRNKKTYKRKCRSRMSINMKLRADAIRTFRCED